MHPRQHLELRHLKVIRRPHARKNCLRLTRRPMNIEAELDHLLDDLLYVLFRCLVLHRYDHVSRLFLLLRKLP